MPKGILASLTLVLFSLCNTQAQAFAAGPEWHWTTAEPGGFYDGSINLNDGGAARPFSRYGSGLTPNISNDTVSTPPLLLMAGGADIDISIGRTGVAVPKKSCPAPSVLSVFATPVTVCDSGVANNIQGIHVNATDGGATFTPQLWVYVAGSGWKQVTANHPCGQLEIKQLCK